MIRIKTNNLFFQKALQEQFAQVPDFFSITVDQKLVLSDGEDSKTYPLPVQLSELKNQISLMEQKQDKTTFENNAFLFSAQERKLTEKKTGKVTLLTEKETQLISFLGQHVDESVSKEDLLKHVWAYHPEALTHTVESHIYALRQKISENAEVFIHTTDDGYMIKSTDSIAID